MAAPLIVLTVAGQVVASNDPAQPAVRADCQPLALTRNYDEPAELRIGLDGWQPAAFAAESVAKLEINGALVFEGLLTLPTSDASIGDVMTVYVARDRLAIHRPALSPEGYTSWEIPAGTLGSAVAALIDGVGDALDEMGISQTPLFMADCDDLPTLPVKLENVKIDEAVRRVAAAAPGVRAFCDPNGGTPALFFCPIFSAPPVTLTVEQEVVESLRIERSLEGCAGAVRMAARQASGASAFVVEAGTLAAAWDPAMTSRWTVDDYLTFANDGVERPESLVFRRWSFAGLPSGVPPSDAEIICQAQVRVASGLTQWRDLEIAEVDLENRIVLTREPIVAGVRQNKPTRRVGRSPGRATAGVVRMKYRRKSSGSVTVPGPRFPASGFAGRAYDEAPTLMGFEAAAEVPDGVDQTAYAAAAHAVLSEPVVRGQIALNYLLPDDLYRLRRRISIASTTHNPCGYEELAAPLMGVEWDARAATLTLDLSTQRTLPGGA